MTFQKRARPARLSWRGARDFVARLVNWCAWPRGDDANDQLARDNAEAAIRECVPAQDGRHTQARVADLEARLKRNQRNSSMPPSAEGLAKPAPNRAERRKAKGRPGKQPGSEGHHLARVEHPDEVVHAPSVGGHCSENLAAAEIVDFELLPRHSNSGCEGHFAAA
jgi:hypothetical protein